MLDHLSFLTFMSEVLSIFSQRLAAFSANPHALKGIGRGVERETLRITHDSRLSSKPHPPALGSALTHQWITTDFAEQLLEFITPVSKSVPEIMGQLYDIHRFTYRALGDELLWPLSMPCYIGNEDDITLAQYGTSNVGKMKTLYRKGLKRRYGSVMQIISGLHFNFSFPDSFWEERFGPQDKATRQASVSDAYFGLIRNYYRFGWMIPYLFGASPALSASFIDKADANLRFKKLGEWSYYLPYATSLRLSDLGYTSAEQSALEISFNSLDEYLEGVQRAIETPSVHFSGLDVKDEETVRCQLNANVLQIENELYAPIRPKRVTQSGEKPSHALARAGVEYIEVRSLDVNPYSPVGLDETQIYFLDLFLTWCTLSDSDPMTHCELDSWRDNWQKVALEGRKPGLTLQIGCQDERLTQTKWGQQVFVDLAKLAVVMDEAYGGDKYQSVCKELVTYFDHPEKTISGRLLDDIISKQAFSKVGMSLAKDYREQFEKGDYMTFSEEQFLEERALSFQRQKAIEEDDKVNFDQYLNDYFSKSEP